jgi:flavin-dependent dehydrogenase
MQEVEEYLGYGTVLRKPERNTIRIGEAGGFQDELWGFGMRMAMESGVLAARAILEGRDYWDLVDQRLTPLVQRCSLNRRTMDAAGDRGYAIFAHRLAESEDPRALIRLFHEPGYMSVTRSIIALGLKI